MADDTLFIEVKALGLNTIKEVEDAVKKLKAEVKSSTLGTGEYIAKESQLLALQEKKITLNDRLATSQGKLMKSYFQTGEQIRHNLVASQNLGRVLQDMPYGIMGVANNIEPLITSFRNLRMEVGSAGAALKTMFIGPGGAMIAISAFVAALQFIPMLFRETTSEVGNLRLRLAELRKDYQEIYRLKMASSKEAMESPWWKKLLYGASLGVGLGGGAGMLSLLEPTEEQKLESDIAREEAKQALERGISKGGKDNQSEYQKYREELYQKWLAGSGGKGAYRVEPRGTFRAPVQRGVIKMGVDTVEPIRNAMMELTTLQKASFESLSDSVNSFASDIRSEIGDAWEATFGEANSLFEKFMMNVVSTMGQIIAQRGAFSLLSLIPGFGFLSSLGFASGGTISEPVAGVGLASGRAYTFGETGPERVTPVGGTHGRAGGGGNVGTEVAKALNGMQFRLDGKDIVLSYDKTKQMKSTTTISFRKRG